MTDNPTPPADNPTPPAAPPAGGDQPSEFLTSLGEQYASNEHFKGIEDAAGLAGKYAETMTKFGEMQQTIDGIPKAPESADGYTIPDAPQGVSVDETALGKFRDAAHKAGFTDEQFQAGVSAHFQMVAEMVQQVDQEHQTMMADLKKEMGSKFDDNLALVNQVVEKFELGEALISQNAGEEATLLRTNPKVFKALLRIGEAIDVDKLPGSATPGSGDRQKTDDGRPMLNYTSMKKK